MFAQFLREPSLVVIHVNTGWNTPEPEQNVRSLVGVIGFDLEIVRVDREETRDLQIAFYKASVKGYG